LFKNRRVVAGLALILALHAAATFAPWLSPYPPDAQVLTDRLKPPTRQHLLGADHLGRDILSRVLWGARVSLAVGLVATLLTIVVGALFGLLSGFFGSWVDGLLMRTTDVFLAFPIFILLITLAAIYGSSVWLLIMFLGLAAWPSTARVVRADVLSIAAREFVMAARAVGASNVRILLVHILPNVVSVLVVAATLRVAIVILTEASLSYVGLGVPPPAATWGSMVADGRLVMDTAWWITTFPGVMVVVTVLAYNMLGDGLRDVLDPRRRLAGQ
jgi:peptide/nickel transport system permease protein